jgi:hypothetical protein
MVVRGLLATSAAFIFIAVTAFYLTFDVWIWTSGAALFASLARPFLTRRSRKQPPIYGASDWASEGEQRRGGMKQTKSAF